LKMALIDNLHAIGDAIRERNGGDEPIPLADMPQEIYDISCDCCPKYTDIAINTRETDMSMLYGVDYIDTNDVKHFVHIHNLGGIIRGLDCDDNSVDIEYDVCEKPNSDPHMFGYKLKSVDNTSIHFGNYEYTKEENVDLWHTVRFLVYGEPFEIKYLAQDMPIVAPLTAPKSPMPEDYNFSHWETDDHKVFENNWHTQHIDLHAVFDDIIDDLYDYYGIDKEIYSEFIMVSSDGMGATVYITKPGGFRVSNYTSTDGDKKQTTIYCEPGEFYQIIRVNPLSEKTTNPIRLMETCIPRSGNKMSIAGHDLARGVTDDDYCYTNGEYRGVVGHWIPFGINRRYYNGTY
jgi:hypothetical protein